MPGRPRHVMHIGFAQTASQLIDFDKDQVSLLMHRAGLAELPEEITNRFARIAAIDTSEGIDADGYERASGQIIAQAGEIAAELGPPSAIIGIFENTTFPAAILRDYFGVPGTNGVTARRFRDKIIMKRALQGSGVPMPEFWPVGPETSQTELVAIAHSLQGKVVLKPRCQAASLGVRVFPDGATFLRHAGEEGLDEGYEVEEFIEGSICHFDGIVRSGQIVFFSASRYLDGCNCLDFRDGSPLATVTIDSLSTVQRAREFTRTVLARLGLEDSSFHLEAFLKSDGEFVFLEGASRFGGAGISLQLKEVYGVDLIEESMLACLGEPSMLSERRRCHQRPTPAASALLLMPIGHAGRCVVRRIRGIEACPDSVVSSKIPDIGKELDGSAGVYLSGGTFILAGTSTAAVVADMDTIMAAYKIEVEAVPATA